MPHIVNVLQLHLFDPCFGFLGILWYLFAAVDTAHLLVVLVSSIVQVHVATVSGRLFGSLAIVAPEEALLVRGVASFRARVLEVLEQLVYERRHLARLSISWWVFLWSRFQPGVYRDTVSCLRK